MDSSHIVTAQRAIRAFARATNLLICGQYFSVPAHSDFAVLREHLRGMGARVGEQVLPGTQAAFATEAIPGVITVCLPDPRTDGPDQAIRVVDADGVDVLGPDTPAEKRIAWAQAHMPVTSTLVASMRDVVAGRRIGVSLVLEPKTAALSMLLAEAGAQVSVYGHPEETRPAVADHLRTQGIAVYADATADRARDRQLATDFLRTGFDVLIDDGSHLIRAAHGVDGALDSMVGAAEETTSGLSALYPWVDQQRLHIPVIASNDARSKTLFDNAYGTGQSCLTTILDLLADAFAVPAWPLWQARVLVIGYGDVGRGFARLAQALGAQVSVAEQDAVRQLQAHMDGHEVGPAEQLAAKADLVVSATGVAHTITPEMLRLMAPGAACVVIGGVDQEISLDAALEQGATWQPIRPGVAVEKLVFADGHHVVVLDRGQCINCTAGEGNPVEIMDLSFGVQVSAIGYLLTTEDRLSARIHRLPRDLDDAVARLGVEARTLS